jgi:pimeloyl-ACP methyl ester carboxylesterase
MIWCRLHLRLSLSLMTAFVVLAVAALAAEVAPRWRSVPVPPAMPKPLESGFAPVNGIAMYYAIYGSGTPILLIHGGLSSSDVWASEIPALATKHEVIVADSRGQGRSTWTGQRLSYELMASDYLALLDYLQVRKVAVVGWSDGGIIGLNLAIHHPDRLTALFAQAANASPDGLFAQSKSDRWSFLSSMRRSVKAMRNLAAAALDAAETRISSLFKRPSPSPDRPAALRRAVFELWASEPHFTRQQLASITVRTAIVIGDHDEVVRRDHTEYLANTIPGARLIILTGVDHSAVLEDPAAYTRAVLDFIDERRP